MNLRNIMDYSGRKNYIMDYEKIVHLVREIVPLLSLKSTNRDLAQAIRNIGILLERI